VATAFPDLSIIPYVIPGRTGAQLLPEDLALLFKHHPNVNTVKEATGNLDNMRRTRRCCGPEFTIFSGDDGLVYEMMADPDIAATGVISVVSNIAPKAMSDLVRLLVSKETEAAKRLTDALRPLFGLVTVQTMEQSPFGEVVCRARNPLALKTLMQLLGVPSGPCRAPLGKMSRGGLDVVVNIAKTVQSKNPEILAPLAAFFNVDIDARLNDERLLGGTVLPDVLIGLGRNPNRPSRLFQGGRFGYCGPPDQAIFSLSAKLAACCSGSVSLNSTPFSHSSPNLSSSISSFLMVSTVAASTSIRFKNELSKTNSLNLSMS
jgi:hypothetical protein